MCVLNIKLARKVRPYSVSEYFGRFLWGLCVPFFRFSPRSCFGFRRFILRVFGARMGPGANVYPTTKIYIPWMLSMGEDSCIGEWVLVYNLGHVKIGDRATISHLSHICSGTHDYLDPALPLIRSKVSIEADSWICSSCFVGPGVTIGRGAVLGAASVALQDIPEWSVYGGFPAKFLKERDLRSLNS